MIKCRQIPSGMSASETRTASVAVQESNSGRLTLVILALSSLLLMPAAATAADPAKRYSDYCSVCHGDGGRGGLHAQQGMIPPPRNFADAEFAATMTRERMIQVIRDGKPGTAMIAWESTMSDAEIGEIADYIIDKFMQRRTEGDTTDQTAGDGALIYQESCSVCHGDDGKGAIWGQESLAMPPRDFTTDAAQRELTRDRMIAAVTFGRPGTPMPGFGTQLSPDQVVAIVNYIGERFMSGAAAAGEVPSGNPLASGVYQQQPYPQGLSGQYERGRAMYMGNCVTCHGVGGAGDGPRAYFIFPRPRNFQDPATQQVLNRPALFRGIKDGVIGREMPAWGKVMDDQMIADISEYVYREFIRSQ